MRVSGRDRVFSTAGPPGSAQAKPRWTHFLYYYLLSVSVSVSLCCRGVCGGGTHPLTRLRGFHIHRINNTPGCISSVNLAPARVVCGCYKGLKSSEVAACFRYTFLPWWYTSSRPWSSLSAGLTSLSPRPPRLSPCR